MAAQPQPSTVERLDYCPKCNTTSKRSLVVCIDGTSNQFGIHWQNTNVVELYSRLTKNENQRTFYNSGIGTYAEPHGLTLRQWIENILDLTIAWRFDKVLLSAYRWLSETYEAGDRIFLFGFSRGAYQVRALSGMIRDVGLIHKGNQDQIPFAFKLYADSNARQVWNIPLSRWEKAQSYLYHLVGKKFLKEGAELVDVAPEFKETFSRGVTVHFVGAWDTVSSVGVVYDQTLPGTTDGMKHVCRFRHALAIHERRVKFLPEFAGVGASKQHEHERDSLQELLTSENDAPEPDLNVKEVWFAGSHSDIGGANKLRDMKEGRPSYFGPSFRWMLWESRIAGLKLDDKGPIRWAIDIQSYESLTWYWWLLEWFCFKRLSFLDSSKRDATTYWPHRGQWRSAFNDQKLHETALEFIGRDHLRAKALDYVEKRRKQDNEANSTGAPSDLVQGSASAPYSHPDLRFWPDLDIEADPFYDPRYYLHQRARSDVAESQIPIELDLSLAPSQ